MAKAVNKRWQRRLIKEFSFRSEFASLTEAEWRVLLKTRKVTSTNYDTVLSLDFPHHCADATVACGGQHGWCYTFQGKQTNKNHDRHAAMVDVLARNFPELFGEAITAEVRKSVESGQLPYANLRYSGSGEIVEEYLPALRQVINNSITLWGFSRNLRVAKKLRSLGAAVIISCDSSSPPGFVDEAVSADFKLAYTSLTVKDIPPAETIVTFPVHRVGRVREVVDSPTVCPKVLEDFLRDSRPRATCQIVCKRCHHPE